MSAKLLPWLQERAAAIATLEKNANTALHSNGDEPTYRDFMHQKALLLAQIARDAAPMLAAEKNHPQYTQISETLESFAAGANNALRLNSIFYKSALLYPDDYQEGEPNNLERLILSILP